MQGELLRFDYSLSALFRAEMHGVFWSEIHSLLVT